MEVDWQCLEVQLECQQCLQFGACRCDGAPMEIVRWGHGHGVAHLQVGQEWGQEWGQEGRTLAACRFA